MSGVKGQATEMFLLAVKSGSGFAVTQMPGAVIAAVHCASFFFEPWIGCNFGQLIQLFREISAKAVPEHGPGGRVETFAGETECQKPATVRTNRTKGAAKRKES